MLITLTCRFAAYSTPAMTPPKVPLPVFERTLTAISLACGAMLAITKALVQICDATHVPCRLSSPHAGNPPVVFWFGTKAVLNARSTQPVSSGWVSSIPVSRIATRAPCPWIPVGHAWSAWMARMFHCHCANRMACEGSRVVAGEASATPGSTASWKRACSTGGTSCINTSRVTLRTVAAPASRVAPSGVSPSTVATLTSG